MIFFVNDYKTGTNNMICEQLKKPCREMVAIFYISLLQQSDKITIPICKIKKKQDENSFVNYVGTTQKVIVQM